MPSEDIGGSYLGKMKKKKSKKKYKKNSSVKVKEEVKNGGFLSSLKDKKRFKIGQS